MLIGIAIQGSGETYKPCWIIRYRIEISMDGIHWGCVLDSHGQIEYYGGNVDVDSVSISHLSTSLAARYVRIIPKAWHGCICLRLEVYVEDLTFNPTGVPIGLESGSFDHITVSTEAEFYPGDSIGLNNGNGGWCASSDDSDPYLEVDLQLDHAITGIVVQGTGHTSFDAFVEEFQIETKKQGTEYKYIKDSYGLRKNFEGGRNSFNSISPSPIARFVRINITKSHLHACMRLEIYVNELYNPADLPEGVPVIQNGLVDISTITASSSWPKYLPSRSPLGTLPALPEYGGSWCAAQESTDESKEWIQMDIGYETTVNGVVLQGDPTRDFWVSRFIVSTSINGELFEFIKSGDSAEPEAFEGSTSRDGYAITKFAPPLSARFIRITPESWKDCICLRWEVYVDEAVPPLDNPGVTEEPQREADTTPPDFTCPSNFNETVPRGQTQVFITWQIPTATDESGTTYQITVSRGPGIFYPGTYNITYVAKDPSGNEWSCTFTITVFKQGPTCPADFSVTPPNKKVYDVQVDWVVDEGVTCVPHTGKFKSGLHNITCTLDSLSCDFQVTVEDIMPPNFLFCESKRIRRNGNQLTLSRRVTGSDNSGTYSINCRRKADGANLPYDEELVWDVGQTDVECIITDGAGLTDTMAPCELSITVGPSQPALECPEDRYVTLTDEKQSVDMEWGVNSGLECTPSVFDEEGTYEVLCIKGFQTCEFEFQVYVKKEECPEVEYPNGVALFSGNYLDESNVEVSSTRSNIHHGADKLPLIDPANNPLAWCAAETTTGEEYVSIILRDPLYVYGIVLRGNNHEDYPAWVESVRLEYVDTSGVTKVIEGIFKANVGPNCDAVITLPHPKKMQILRIFPEVFTPSNLLCMRVEVYAHLGN
eukprot:XP_003725142.2 PREDICTED: uncharacterized protein LOC100892119 [Strongylocentrotus purpuratus]